MRYDKLKLQADIPLTDLAHQMVGQYDDEVIVGFIEEMCQIHLHQIGDNSLTDAVYMAMKDWLMIEAQAEGGRE